MRRFLVLERCAFRPFGLSISANLLWPYRGPQRLSSARHWPPKSGSCPKSAERESRSPFGPQFMQWIRHWTWPLRRPRLTLMLPSFEVRMMV